MTKCPRCFNFLPADIWSFTRVSPDDTQPDEAASAYRGHPVKMGRVLDINTATTPNGYPTIEQASAELGGPSVEVCPICHYKLPARWRWGQVTCLAMAGARFTGKTVYIAVMVKQLERRLEQLGMVLEPANVETQTRYRKDYETPLFEERGLMPSTSSGRIEGTYQHDPLIFHIGQWHNVPQYMAIRDVAGEDLEDPNVGGTQWEFFSAADAVIFMFDPMRVQEVKAILAGLVPTNQYTGGDPRDVLRTVLRLMGGGAPRLAIVLSKFDALQAMRRVATHSWGQVMSHAGAAFSRDPGLLRGPYDDVDSRLLDAEVRSLLTKLDAGSMLHLVSASGRGQVTRYFAVSALGDSPQGQRLNASGISPFRCMDPVRWVLAERGLL